MSVELRRPVGDRVMIWVLGGFLAFFTLMMVFAGFAAISAGEETAYVVFIVAIFMGVISWPLLGEALSRGALRVTLGYSDLELVLPRQRSYLKLDPVKRSLRYEHVRAIETRMEAFRGAGNTVIQQSYALVLTNGERIVLGGDRRWLEPFFEKAAIAIAQRCKLNVTDLGGVDADAGFLMFWGQKAPAWGEGALTPEVHEKRVRDESKAWQVVSIVVGAALLIGAIARFLN